MELVWELQLSHYISEQTGSCGQLSPRVILSGGALQGFSMFPLLLDFVTKDIFLNVFSGLPGVKSPTPHSPPPRRRFFWLKVCRSGRFGERHCTGNWTSIGNPEQLSRTLVAPLWHPTFSPKKWWRSSSLPLWGSASPCVRCPATFAVTPMPPRHRLGMDEALGEWQLGVSLYSSADGRSLTEAIAVHHLSVSLPVPVHRLAFRAPFVRAGHRWIKQSGGRAMTRERGMKKLISLGINWCFSSTSLVTKIWGLLLGGNSESYGSESKSVALILHGLSVNLVPHYKIHQNTKYNELRLLKTQEQYMFCYYWFFSLLHMFSV